MKTNKFIFAVLTLLFIALIAISCSGNQKFDSVESTEIERYSIVYKDGKSVNRVMGARDKDGILELLGIK